MKNRGTDREWLQHVRELPIVQSRSPVTGKVRSLCNRWKRSLSSSCSRCRFRPCASHVKMFGRPLLNQWSRRVAFR